MEVTMKKYGDPLTNEELELLFEETDKDGDG